MKINLLLNPNNRAWIIQKIAERLASELTTLGVEATITDVVDEGADVVHHMSWAFAGKTRQPSTMFITHLDDAHKLNQVRGALAREVDVGICMSSDTMQQLSAHGCDSSSLYFISPAHDGQIKPRRIVIGITSRVYPDGRKREVLLHELAERMDLAAFEFRIFGLGWEPTIAKLKAAGAAVQYFGESDDYRKDYEAMQAAIPHFDYYLYLGLDEGSLGTLDALCAGVPTIITPQGFHLDLPGGITHAVVTADDLQRVFGDIATAKRALSQAVAPLTWPAYAAKHLALWQSLVRKSPRPPLPDPTEVSAAAVAALEAARSRSMVANSLRPRRILSSISHLPVFRVIRRAVDKRRLKP